MRIGSLFSGAGGLDMAVQNVFGGDVVWHSEVDPAASKVLAHRFPDVPNLGDITQIDWESFAWQKRGEGPSIAVDVLCGGWPCQPWSIAGSKKGADDERALWPHVADAVRSLRPRYVVLENVSNVVVLGELARAVGDLAAAGYDSQWACVRASDVGAPHRRERLFIVATDTSGDGWHEGRPEPAGLVGGSDAAVGGPAAVGLLPTPTSRDHKGANQRNDETCLHGALLATPQARDSKGVPKDDYNSACLPRDIVDCELSWGKYESAIRRWESLTRSAPQPTIPGAAGLRRPRLNPEFSEWMLGWPAGWVTAVPDLKRNDQLRIIGNGVVPLQAEAALRYLLTVAEVAA